MIKDYSERSAPREVLNRLYRNPPSGGGGLNIYFPTSEIQLSQTSVVQVLPAGAGNVDFNLILPYQNYQALLPAARAIGLVPVTVELSMTHTTWRRDPVVIRPTIIGASNSPILPPVVSRAMRNALQVPQQILHTHELMLRVSLSGDGNDTVTLRFAHPARPAEVSAWSIRIFPHLGIALPQV